MWTRSEVSGSRFAVSDNGWVDHELFSYFLTEHLIQNAVPHRPLLLLLDGHSTHFEPKSLQVAKDSNIVIFCLPPHTTHVCQPLDCSLFKPLNSNGGRNVINSIKRILDWWYQSTTFVAYFERPG